MTHDYDNDMTAMMILNWKITTKAMPLNMAFLEKISKHCMLSYNEKLQVINNFTLSKKILTRQVPREKKFFEFKTIFTRNAFWLVDLE